MAALTAMALMMAVGHLPASEIDFDLGDRTGQIDDLSDVRFTQATPTMRRSRYMTPEVIEIDADEDPPKLRWRGRKIKLRVPVGPGS